MADAVVTAVRDTLLSALSPLLAEVPSVALLDFPAHGNVGDSAIWLGAHAALRALGAPSPSYTCDAETYDRDALRRRIGTGTILFTGGGSFGDLWERHLLFRERVVADFPRNRIIQLPESVHFERADTLARSRSVFNAHSDVTILVRDAASLAVIRREFRAPTLLVPDMAFALGALPRPVTPTRDILWLKRKDKEDLWPDAAANLLGDVVRRDSRTSERAPMRSADERAPTANPDVIDWLEEEKTPLIAWTDRLRWDSQRRPRLRRLGWPALAMTQPILARSRMKRGVTLLSSARVVITDRLHGHILALLLGIPHVVLDNTYGKVHRFAAEWTVRSPLVRLATSPEEAMAHARLFLSALHG